MSAAAQEWEPGRNAVHRLLQLCDVLAIALNRFRQLSFGLPSPPDPQFATERDRLRADYFAIAQAVFPASDAAPQHTAFRLATDAAAELVRAGSGPDQSVGTAQEWMEAVGWILVPHPYPTWTLDAEWHKQFDEEGQSLKQHSRVRQGLIVAIARVGQSLPTHIQQRTSIAVHAWPPSQAEPVTQAQLLGWVRETQPAVLVLSPPPHAPNPSGTSPNGTQQGEGEKSKPDVKPDGPFDADGFRFAGVEVRFRRAAKQYCLVKALWDSTTQLPAPARSVTDVIADVYGDENETSDPAFRQLLVDVRKRFQSANCLLDIQQMNGKVQLSRL